MSLTETPHPTSTKDAEGTPHGVGLASYDRLVATWGRMVQRREVRGRRGAVGIDGVRVEVFAQHLERNVREIARVLARRGDDGATAYRLGPLVSRTLVTPRGQQRTVFVPRLRDQLVMRVVADEVAAAMRRARIPTAPPTFLSLVRRLREALGAGAYRFALRADVASYYASIPHAPLLARVDALDVPGDARALVRSLLACPIRKPLSAAGTGEALSCGVPPGVSVSSVLGELYLAGVDDDLRGLGLPCFRYVDDLLVLCPDLPSLGEAEARLRASLEAHGLRLSEAKLSRVNLDLGTRFVGLDVSLSGLLVAEERVERWVSTRSRLFRSAARQIAAAPSRDEALAALATVVARLNRDISGCTGLLVPLLAATGQVDLLRRLDELVRTALGGIFRRLGLTPSGPFRIARAEAWGQRWRTDARRARRAAHRLFGAQGPPTSP